MQMNNFNGCMEILSGLKCGPFYRMKHFQQMIMQEKCKGILNELDQITINTKNFSNLRTKIIQVPFSHTLFLSDFLGKR